MLGYVKKTRYPIHHDNVYALETLGEAKLSSFRFVI